jgi:serine/threonine-protein kinase
VLFEVFTGKPAFQADTPAELARLREDSTPSAPSNIVADLDPAVERVILQCLEKEPRERPRSALAVSAALPGGDPLAAALAAGETPSPEMVAAAGESGRLHPRVAITWLAALLLGLVVAALLADEATVVGNAGLSKKPDALEEDAREIIQQFGYDSLSKDSAYGFQYDADYLWSLRREGGPSSRGETAKCGELPGMHFWYRQSPDYLVPVARYAWVVSGDDPPPVLPGMAGVRLNPKGHLIEFHAVPGEGDQQTQPLEGAGWERLFRRAGLDLGQFTEVTDGPMGPTSALGDRRVAWKETDLKGNNKIDVEAASYRGRPVYFRVVEACPKPERMPLGIPPSDRQPIRVEEIRAFEWTSLLIVLVAAALLARRSLRLGRSDRKGALRLGLFILSINLLTCLFEASHVPHFFGELALVCSGLLYVVFYAVYFGLMYLAFEPYIRRFWPTLLISWNRLLTGRFRDPAVGRDLLVGAAVGVWFWPVLEFLTVLAPDWLGPVQPFWRTLPSTLLGGRHLLAVSVFCLTSVGVSLLFLLTLLLLRLLLRKWWLWAPAFVFFGMFVHILADVASLARWLMAAALMTSLLLLYIRLGLVAAIASFFASYMLTDFPITADWDAWYWGSSLYALTVVAAIGVCGFYTSTTGRPLFGDRLART